MTAKPPSAPPPPEPVALPADLLGAIRLELRRAVRPPYEVPVVIAVNGVLMCAAWLVVPPTLLVAKLGALAFPLVLASWMYSDVPATNVLASDARRSSAALDEATRHADAAPLRRLWVAKNFALWVLITPIAVTVAIAVGAHERRGTATVAIVVWILLAPLGALGAAGWLGIAYPYHPMKLIDRWRRRSRTRTMLVRWAVLILIPYLVVPALTVLVLAPTILLWALGAHHDAAGRISDPDILLGTGLACVSAALAWIGGHRVGLRLARRRAASLRELLDDPYSG